MSRCTVEREGAVLAVTHNRPEARSSWSSEMSVGMRDASGRLDSDPELRAALLTGAGGHFRAGAEPRIGRTIFATEEARGGPKAFAQKREPVCKRR